ncbi:MAG: preprotein translocase subunit SecE [Lachnospiraceae bacterium]|uniref:preprotein translocase subunit SecE n=1 Tax=Falcatimonas sp. MSJ-15 TaxID=2841515 RepID=UPI001C119B6D|nr:preprotein translocase subunit SecE [Falcatimonas sp. MSJ-15]MBQ5735114.1 preprotein translocase subunit SecE [Lachnospiraceae bacterium]MBU5469331.1 preprotein translocase subunit SecE [Falcatimonas sp. MSJ-15]MEE0960723.1 preprotein translocase subunit SecE [Lachnospiraceae bacterium]
MSETAAAKEKAPKKSFFNGLKAEFNKIIWPDKKSLTKQSIAVTVISVVLGLIIALLDLVIKFGVEILVK